MSKRKARGCLAIVTPVLLTAAWLAGCSEGRGKSADDAKPRVVATTTMVADLVRRVGGERVDVKVLMGPGVDPHTYKPSPDDIAELNGARLIVYNGLHLEGKMVELFEGTLKPRAFAVTSAMPHGQLQSWKQEEGADGAAATGAAVTGAAATGAVAGDVHDPHVWFNVALWAMAVEPVSKRLGELLPQYAGEFSARATAYSADLAKLHAEVADKVKSIPEGRRVLITSHDAYTYFGEAYGIKVRGLQGISTETEAGLREVNQAVAYIVENRIPALFVETSVNPKTIEQVLADCRARGFDGVKIGGELYSDAMGAPGEKPGYAVETYEGMVRYNVDTIVGALK